MAGNYKDQFSETFDESLEIKPSYVPEGMEEACAELIHNTIPVAIGQHISKDQGEYRNIFGIDKVSRVLNEGYRFQNGVKTEDFAISSPNNGGELVIGQVVSCNEKNYFGGKSFDVIQAENFERRLSSNNSLESAIKNIYTIRTDFEPAEVIDREREIRRELERNRNYDLGVKIIRLERPEEIDWSQVTSMLHDT